MITLRNQEKVPDNKRVNFMKGQYIQFYKRCDKVRSYFLVEDTGNVVKLDGRLSLGKCCRIATEMCRKYNYKGFSIMVQKDIETPDEMLMTLWKVFPDSVEC